MDTFEFIDRQDNFAAYLGNADLKGAIEFFQRAPGLTNHMDADLLLLLSRYNTLEANISIYNTEQYNNELMKIKMILLEMKNKYIPKQHRVSSVVQDTGNCVARTIFPASANINNMRNTLKNGKIDEILNLYKPNFVREGGILWEKFNTFLTRYNNDTKQQTSPLDPVELVIRHAELVDLVMDLIKKIVVGNIGADRALINKAIDGLNLLDEEAERKMQLEILKSVINNLMIYTLNNNITNYKDKLEKLASELDTNCEDGKLLKLLITERHFGTIKSFIEQRKAILNGMVINISSSAAQHQLYMLG